MLITLEAVVEINEFWKLGKFLMSDRQSQGPALPRLVLYPEDPAFVPQSFPLLIEQLTEFGVLGKPWCGERYLVGHRFMQEIVFVGCSPFLRVEPQDDLDFCHIEIPEPLDAPELQIGSRAGQPRCPVCRSVLSPDSDGGYWCKDCNVAVPGEQCLWRPGSTVNSRVAINIHGIQKGDAHPTEGLMARLAEITETPWKLAFL